MIALDTQLVVYATHPEALPYELASQAVQRLILLEEPVAVPMPCVHEIVNTLSRPKLWKKPMTTHQALSAVETLLDGPNILVVKETEHHLPTLRHLIDHIPHIGPKIHDARIAAICLGHKVDVLWTADRDFSLFPQLRTHNPLA